MERIRKMKKCIVLFFYALIVLGNTSCEKVFDFNDDGRYTLDLIFSDGDLAKGYLNTCYSSLNSIGQRFNMSVYSDEAQDVNVINNSTALRYYQGQQTSSNILVNGESLYKDMYIGINRCNTFLENVEKVPSFPIPADESRCKAEAYLLRAFYYLQLIKRYGAVPIIKETLPLDYDYSQKARTTFYDCAQAIVEDCRLALDEPELKYRITDADQEGELTRAVAYAIMSQTMLYAASPLWNNGENHWEEALAITKEAKEKLEEAGFDLFNPGKILNKGNYSVYQDYFLSKPEIGENPQYDKETIYALKNRAGELWKNYGLPIVTDATSAGMCPTQELVDAYETIDGEPILDLNQPYLDKAHTLPNYNKKALLENGGQYDPNNPYSNRDPRLHSSIYCNGDYYRLDTQTSPVWTYVGGTSGFLNTNIRYTNTGYYVRKFINYTSGKDSNNDGFWRYFRMAEIYLNYAEAEYYANGVTTQALAAINKVRGRVGMPNLPSDISSEDFELRLRNERRIEFAFEDQRYYDVRRWKILVETDGVVSGYQIQSDGKTGNRLLVQERDCSGDRYYLTPIPISEQNRYLMFGVEYQNPGW